MASALSPQMVLIAYWAIVLVIAAFVAIPLVAVALVVASYVNWRNDPASD